MTPRPVSPTSAPPARRLVVGVLAATALFAAGAVPATAATPAAGPVAPASFPSRTAGRIVYDVDLSDSHSRIDAINPDGNQHVALTDGTASDLGPDVSADGRRVAFFSDRSGSYQVWTMNADGTGLAQLTDGAGQAYYPSWSPDGTRIAFRLTTATDAGDVYVVPATGGTPVRLTTTPGLDSLPEWSPDGTRIAFHSSRDDADPAGCADQCVQAVYVMAADGSNPTRVAYDPGARDRFPNWSPDGTRLTYEHWDSTDPGSPTYIWTVRADGTGAAAFAPAASYGYAEAPDYSPDGKRLVFENLGALYTVPVGGGAVSLVLPNDDGYALAPDWSVITPAPQNATVAFAVAPAAPVWGQPVRLSARVKGTAGSGTPTGTVTFTQGSRTVGSPVPLDAQGRATLTTRDLLPFAGTIAAHYGGDATHTAAVAFSAVGVAQAQTATTLSVPDGATLVYGDRVTATVHTLPPSRGVPDGDDVTVNYDGFQTSAPITSGVAVVPSFALTVGTHTLQVCGPATQEYLGSCSATVSVTVTPATPTVALRATPNPVAAGRRATLVARVSPSDGGESVDFTVDGVDQGVAGVDANGEARLQVTFADPGDHTVSATTAGDDNLAPASSPDLTVHVTG